jgi:hypothetical protein
MITEDYDDLFDDIRARLGEHFSNYMFIVMDDDGDLYYDYNNHKVGRMLLKETKADMEGEVDALDIIWDDIEEVEDEDGDTIY